MDIVCQRGCGLDVHKKSVVACVITHEGQQSRSFRTMTDDLLSLAERLTRKARRLMLHLHRRWPRETQFSDALSWLRALPLAS